MKTQIGQFIMITLGSFVALAAGPRASAPTALELLDKFAASQEPVKSFVASYEETAQTDFPGAKPPIKGGSSDLGDMRMDFPRVAERNRRWGAFGGTKAQPRYSSLLTDRHLVLYYDRQSDAGDAMVMPQLHPATDITCMAEAIGRSVSLRACFGICCLAANRGLIARYSEGDVRLEAALAKAGIQVDTAAVATGEAQMQELAPPTPETKRLRDEFLRATAAKGEEGGRPDGKDKPMSADQR